MIQLPYRNKKCFTVELICACVHVAAYSTAFALYSLGCQTPVCTEVKAVFFLKVNVKKIVYV